MRTLGGEGPLSHGLRRASSPRGRAKGGRAASQFLRRHSAIRYFPVRSVSFLRQMRTADGRPYGVGRTKAFSSRRRWPGESRVG